MGCHFSWLFVMAFALSGCSGPVDTGPAPTGGYNTSKVKYEDPLANVPKTNVEIGEFVVTQDAGPVRLEKVITARNSEVFTFRGQIRGQPLLTRTHHIVVECTRDSEFGPLTMPIGVGVCQVQGEHIVYGVTVRSPQTLVRHRFTVKMIRALRDDGTMLSSESEQDSTVIAEGEIEVRADEQKLTPSPDQLPPKQ